jgi:lactoylglutathione lyase
MEPAARYGTIEVVPMTWRFEIFPADLNATVDFYTRVLGVSLVKDQRHEVYPYVALERDAVRIGAAARVDQGTREHRQPPTGVELVFEVDDLDTEHDRVVASGWPLTEDLQQRPWGLRDFRILDPSGHYLRMTGRAP